ncbi:MAG: HAMP domain-containing protein [Anaerolineae bacterium]|nr:HAMP domain-containing protein [Anaerolineae bacterium]
MPDQPIPSVGKRLLNTLLRFISGIRGKIIMPYLFLTFTVAVIGLYVVTRLLSSSLDERFNNHLLNSGRAVLTGFARQEIDHLEAARTFSLTEGVIEALRERDTETLSTLVLPAAKVRGVDMLIMLDDEGNMALNALKRDGQVELVEYDFRPSDVWLVERLLEQHSPSAFALRAIGEHPVDNEYYYFTAAPIALEEEFVGVVLVGTTLDVLLPDLNAASMAEITVYLNQGQAIASTFARGMSAENQAAPLTELSIPPGVYSDILESEGRTRIETVVVAGRDYRLSRGLLVVGNDRLAVFDVALPSDFLLDSNAVNRSSYVVVFGLAMGAVILLGYGVAQRITRPLFTLVKTSQAVAEGDLKQRTGIQRSDEIGTLATAFDQMTERLDERTTTLKETASRMRSILSSIGDGILVENVEGEITAANKAAEYLLKEMSASFAAGAPLRELGRAHKEENAALNPWLVESRYFQLGDFLFSAHSALIETDEHEHLGTVIVIHDITVEVEVERLREEIKVLRESAFISIPYVAGKPLRPGSEMFYGRDLEFEFIQGHLGQPPHHNHIALIGPPRIGKTSILQHLPRRLDSSKYLPLYINCQSLGIDLGVPAFFLQFARQVRRSLERQEIEISALPDLTYEDLSSTPAFTFTTQFMPHLYRLSGERSLVLCLDEFEELVSRVHRGRLDALILEWLYDLAQQEDKIAFILAGSRWLVELSKRNDAAAAIINMTTFRPVGPLSFDLTKRLIEEPVADMDIHYYPEAIEALLKATGGYPYLIQLLCGPLIAHYDIAGRHLITLGEVQTTIETAIETPQPGFFWQVLTSEQKLVLLAVALLWQQQHTITPHSVETTLDTLGIGHRVWTMSVDVILHELSLYFLLNEERDHTAYTLTFDLLGSWIHRHKTVNRVQEEIHNAA